MSAVSRRRAGAIAAPGRVARRWSTSVRALPSALVVLLVLAFVHATAWAVVTAPWKVPTRSLTSRTPKARPHRPRPATQQRHRGQSSAHNLRCSSSTSSRSGLQPGGRPTYSALQPDEAGPPRPDARAYANGTGPNSAANYPPVYYAYEAAAYLVSPFRSELGRLFFMRLFSVLLMVGVVGLRGSSPASCWPASGRSRPPRASSRCSRSSPSRAGSSTPT